MYILSFILMLVGIYAVAVKENIIKKIIGLSIFTNGIHVFLISLGYRIGGIPPIISQENMNLFHAAAVDPFTQAMVLTSIVISLSVTSLGLVIAIRVYRNYGNLRADKIKGISG